MKQRKTKVEKKQRQQIKNLKKRKFNIHTSFSYTSYHLMKVISQITPWPIMQATKSQKGEGILKDDMKTYQEKEKEKTEGGKGWKRNGWKYRKQGLQEINKVSGFLYKIFKKPRNYEALEGTQRLE